EVAAHRRREGDALELLTLPLEVMDRVAMGRPSDHLADDRARIELGRDVVTGGADDLHAAPVRLTVWVRADERRQEAVVDIDDLVRPLADELGAEDLHVPRKDDDVDVLVAEARAHPRLLVLLVVDRLVDEGVATPLDLLTERVVVREYERY